MKIRNGLHSEEKWLELGKTCFETSSGSCHLACELGKIVKSLPLLNSRKLCAACQTIGNVVQMLQSHLIAGPLSDSPSAWLPPSYPVPHARNLFVLGNLSIPTALNPAVPVHLHRTSCVPNQRDGEIMPSIWPLTTCSQLALSPPAKEAPSEANAKKHRHWRVLYYILCKTCSESR